MKRWSDRLVTATVVMVAAATFGMFSPTAAQSANTPPFTRTRTITAGGKIGPDAGGTAWCPQGWHVTGGGSDNGTNRNNRLTVVQSHIVWQGPLQGWFASVSGSHIDGTVWRVYAMCVR